MIKRLLLYCFFFSSKTYAQEHLYDYTFFTNSLIAGGYYSSKATFQSPSFIKNKHQKLPISETIFHTPGTALKLEYINGKNGNWKAAIFREEIRSQDHFKPVQYFSFSVYAQSTNITSKYLPAYQFILHDSSLSDLYTFEINKINAWETITIPVSVFNGIDFKNPSDIIGVVFSQNNDEGNKHTIYLDDIEFLSSSAEVTINAKPHILTFNGYAKHVDISWQPFIDSNVRYVKIYRSENGRTFTPVGIQLPLINRYADYTGVTGKTYRYKISFLDNQYRETAPSNIVTATTRSMTDDQLLTMVQEACFRYYWEGSEKISGLSKENIPGRTNMIAAGASGFGIMALIVGTERKFITRNQSVKRFIKIVNFLENAEKFHGAFPHFIDGSTGKVEPFFGMRDNGGDLVETSFLLQGLLVARAYFNKENNDEKIIREKITTIWQNIEWDWYRRYPDSKYLYWHWSPDQEWIINHRLTGWNETMITYLLAIASPAHGVPPNLYYSGWAN